MENSGLVMVFVDAGRARRQWLNITYGLGQNTRMGAKFL